MEEHDLDRRILNEIFSMPERGFQGLVKGFMFAMGLIGALDIFRIVRMTPENQNVQLKFAFACALIGYGVGLQNERRRVDIILNEHAATRLQRIGLFGQRALASRPPHTLSEGLAKGLMFSTTMMIFASNHFETSTILKVIVAAMALCGAWGARNQLRR